MGREMLADEQRASFWRIHFGEASFSKASSTWIREPLWRFLLRCQCSPLSKKGLVVELVLVCAVAILQALCGHIRMAFGFMAGYAVLVAILHLVLPAIGGIAATMFTISLTFARKIYLCLMVGTLLRSPRHLFIELQLALSKTQNPSVCSYSFNGDVALFSYP